MTGWPFVRVGIVGVLISATRVGTLSSKRGNGDEMDLNWRHYCADDDGIHSCRNLSSAPRIRNRVDDVLPPHTGVCP